MFARVFISHPVRDDGRYQEVGGCENDSASAQTCEAKALLQKYFFFFLLLFLSLTLFRPCCSCCRRLACKFNYSLIQFMCFHPPLQTHFPAFFCLGLISAHIREYYFGIFLVCAFLNFSPQINFATHKVEPSPPHTYGSGNIR